jgi:dTDP-4-dehydrorhamnose reductase
MKLEQSPIEIWGGAECTVNRVQDSFFNQLNRSGHSDRIADLNLFAGLGIRALRVPVLWELMQPDPARPIDWKWSDLWLNRIRELGIRPIVGLLHHGSGPLSTNLIDPLFPQKFAAYARLVAERYPWVQDYTPVNEPMTTARFSGLYGFWFPHAKHNAFFVRALLNQCKATQRAMEEIRRVNPAARLIQTEDYGKTYGTDALAPLVQFLNHRRWGKPALFFWLIPSSQPKRQIHVEF